MSSEPDATASSDPVDASPPPEKAPTACAPLVATVVKDGLGQLENLADVGDGSMLVSDRTKGVIWHLMPDGTTSSLVTVEDPGAIVVVGKTVYFTTHNLPTNSNTHQTNGTIERVELDGSDHRVVIDGLVSPNGMVRTSDGHFLVSTASVLGGQITEVVVTSTASTASPFLSMQTPNGLATSGSTLYVATTMDVVSPLKRVDEPTKKVSPIYLHGNDQLTIFDEITVKDGVLYGVGEVSSDLLRGLQGKLARIDPSTGDWCELGVVPQGSSVRFVGDTLHTVGYDGVVRRWE